MGHGTVQGVGADLQDWHDPGPLQCFAHLDAGKVSWLHSASCSHFPTGSGAGQQKQRAVQHHLQI